MREGKIWKGLRNVDLLMSEKYLSWNGEISRLRKRDESDIVEWAEVSILEEEENSNCDKLWTGGGCLSLKRTRRTKR